MSSFRVRPRFKITSEKTVEELNKLLIEQKNRNEKETYIIEQNSGLTVIKIPKNEQHFWSPELHLVFEENNNKTLIRGLYGPKPEIWSFFSFSYIGLAVFSFFALIFGLAQISLKLSAPILWLLPIFAGFAVLIYLIAQFGQKFGAEQTFRLHYFFEESINERIHIH